MMSADIQEPHLSLSRKEKKKKKGNKEESRVEIYENEDVFKQRHTNVRRGRHNNLSAVHRSNFMTASILGFLYLLILAGTFLRYILATLDKDQLNVSLNQAQTRILNLTAERDELQTKYDDLRNLNGQLEEERDQLNISLNQAQTRIIKLTADRDKLQRRSHDGCRDWCIDGAIWHPLR